MTKMQPHWLREGFKKKNYKKVVPGPLRGGGVPGVPTLLFCLCLPPNLRGFTSKTTRKKQISGPLLMGGGGVTGEVGRGPLFCSFFFNPSLSYVV